MSEAADETIGLAGLAAPAEIVLDRWGIPHIRASSEDDLFFAQGFNAARDRLWQIDLWRKRGLGLLARDFGPGYLAQDRASRAFLYRGDMAAEWASYGPGTERIASRFVAGINAYVELTEREPARLPPEFVLLGTAPDRWEAADVVRIRSHALTRNALSEILRAQVATAFGDAADLLRKNLEPRVTPRPAGGIDPSTIPLAVLDLFRLATATVTFSQARLGATLADAEAWTSVTDLGEIVRDAAWQGSNNWAVSAARTETGRPILAGDPHRAHAAPGLRYLVHLSTPGLDVIGAGEPAAPGISMGHNGTSAFGITIFSIDQEDFCVYELQEGDPLSYRYGDGFERMRVVEEAIPVKGEADQPARLLFTRHGPVLCSDPEGGRAFGLRSVWFEPGTGGYLGGLAAMRAQNLAEFRDALRHWGAPSQNHVYADTHGDIAWLPFGMTPIREGWDGLYPVPGDGRFEWQGFRPPHEMPNRVNPAEGFVYSANEFNIPEDFPHDERPIGYEWLEASRARRIREVLAADPRHGVRASAALQTDTSSHPARRLRPLLAGLSGDGDLGAALALLAAWNDRAAVDSAGGALFELWWTKHLRPALFALFVPDPALRALLAPGDVEGMLEAIEKPGRHFGDDPAAGRDRLLAQTLAAAFADARERLGADPAAWRWGDLHHGYFEHPVSGAAPGAGLDVGPLPMGGSASTVMHAAYRPGDFRTTTGASVRFVLDVGAWDNSLCINAPGQSGDPRSPHYADLAPLWARGDYVPFLYSREAVDAAAERRIRLVPDG